MGNAPLLQPVGFVLNPAGGNAFIAQAGQVAKAAGVAAGGTHSLARGLLSVAGGLGIATGIAGITREIVQLGKESLTLALRADTIGTAYESATKRAGIASDDLLTKLNAAARGTVATADLQASANKALALGVGQNATEIASLLAIARQKGKDFGLDTATAFDNIATGLGRLSPRILDNLGIILDENKIYIEYARTIGVVAGKLTDQEKRQALVNELIRTNSDLITKNADAQLSAADKIAQADAKIQNARTKAAAAVLPTIGQFASAGAGIIAGEVTPSGIRARDEALAASTTTMAAYTKARHEANVADLASGDAAQQAVAALAIYQGALANDTVALIQQAGAHERAAKAATDNFAALDRLNRGLIAVPPPRILTPRQEDLAGAVIAGGKEVVAAQHTRDDALLALDKHYAESSKHLFADLNDAIASGITDRARLVASGAKAVADLIASAGLAASRQAEDRARTDARTARGRREEDAASAASYGQQRAALIASQHAAGVNAEEAYQRDLARAARQGQEQQYVSTASFLERLFGLTRGHRNKAELEAGQAALRAAQAEAAELAKTDPAAAAALLAERERQITDAIQRKRHEAQLRRDAKRGGGLSPAEVEAEIAQEDAATKAANEATVAGIKQGAKDKADDRAREKTERAAADKTAIDDLDKTEADRRAKLVQARKEQDTDLAADRAREDLRRGQDYAKQLADLRTSNAQAIADFDTNQAEKIKHIKAAIADEATKYADAHAAILKTYDDLATAIQGKIDEAKRLLDVTPAAEDIMRQKTALQALGRQYGQAFLDAYCDAIGVPHIPVGSGPGGPLGTGSATGAGVGIIPPPRVPPGRAPAPARPPGIHSQSLNGLTVWDQAPTTARTGTASSRAITVDLRGAHFGDNVSETQVRSWIRPELDRALTRFERDLLRETDDLGTRGALA